MKNREICYPTQDFRGGLNSKVKVIVASRGRNPENPSDRKARGGVMKQRLEPNTTGKSNSLTTVAKDNLVLEYEED